jgi:dihydrofolate reductase
MICIIVAYDKNRVIGNKGEIPWHLTDDLKRFQRVTMGHSVIMGRRTWDSIPRGFRPLPGRTNVVISRGEPLIKHNEIWVGSMTEAISASQTFGGSFKDIFIIGGESIYKQALDQKLVHKVIASEVKGEHEGDTFFPELEGQWDREVVEKFDEFDVVEYRRVIIPGKCAWERCVSWITPPGIVACEECGREWCCMECACENDGLDHDTFEMIYELEEVPDKIPITCCKCSGNKPSWMSDEEETS